MELDQFQSLFSALTHFKKNRFHPMVWIIGDPLIGENVFIGGFSEVNGYGAKC